MGLTLTMCRGLPGCGKTTYAKKQQANNPTIVLVCRDDLRRMLHAGNWSATNEEQIVAMENAVIADSLTRGRSVIVHDTGFGEENETRLRTLAETYGAEFAIKDFTHVPIETCIARDLTREHSVGEKVIRDFYARYIAPRALPAPEWDPSLPSAVLVDIDGTVAIRDESVRGPYEHDKCLTDKPNEPVIGLVQDLIDAGETILYCSGREEKVRILTLTWLETNVYGFISPEQLFMRATGDRRPDDVVKVELYEKYIKGKFNIRFVLDDRARVVQAWRLLGLTVFQVAEGAF